MPSIDGVSLASSVIAGSILFVVVRAFVAKLRSFDSFTIVTLGGLGIPAWVARPIGILVLAVEGTLALGLASASYPVATAILGFSLFIAFVLVGLYASVARLSIPCGCFGANRDRLGLQSAAHSAVLTVLIALYGGLAAGGHAPIGGLTVAVLAALASSKWLFDWKQLGRPLAWRQQ